MAYSKFRNGFDIQSATPIDKRIYLTKAEMLRESSEETSILMLPDVYLAICPDDGKLYLYNESNTPNAETGKFKLIDATITFTSQEAKTQFETAINNSTTVQAMEAAIGDENSGLIKAIADTNSRISSLVLDGGEIKEVYILTTDLTGVKLDSEDRSIVYKESKEFEFDLLEGYTTFPTTITVNGITGVGEQSIQCGNTLASWIVSTYDDPPKPYGKLTVQETTGNVSIVVSAT